MSRYEDISEKIGTLLDSFSDADEEELQNLPYELAREIDALTAERDAAIREISEAARKRGHAEYARDEAHARLDEMQAELHVNRKRCGVLQTQLDAIVAMLAAKRDEYENLSSLDFEEEAEERLAQLLHRRAVAIAEGRGEA